MNLVEILDEINESRGRGSEAGRKYFTSKEGAKKEKSLALKSRVTTYKSISQALDQGKYGDVFSTKAANRLYVISKGKWGAKSGRGKIAKGFTPGSSTPSSDYESVKKHAIRTKLRYGDGNRRLAAKYGSRSIKKKFGV